MLTGKGMEMVLPRIIHHGGVNRSSDKDVLTGTIVEGVSLRVGGNRDSGMIGRAMGRGR